MIHFENSNQRFHDSNFKYGKLAECSGVAKIIKQPTNSNLLTVVNGNLSTNLT